MTILGPAASAERRLNVAQSFNAVGAKLSLDYRAGLYSHRFYCSPAQIAAMSVGQLAILSRVEASTGEVVSTRLIAGIFAVVLVLIQPAHLPDVQDVPAGTEYCNAGKKLQQRCFRIPTCKVVIAQFFYTWVRRWECPVSSVAKQAVCGFLKPQPEASHRYLPFHQIGFMRIGYFAGSVIMKKIAAPRLLVRVFAAASLVCVQPLRCSVPA